MESHLASFLLARTEPEYPAEAIAHGIEGDVEVDVVVDREGNVMELEPRSGDPVLTEATVAAVRAWRFRPLKLNGIPVEVLTDVRYRFRLPDIVGAY